MRARPPRLAERLLAWSAPAEHRDAMLGDLAEEFARDVLPALGAVRARRWYWRQALGSVRHNLASRVRRLPARGVGRASPQPGTHPRRHPHERKGDGLMQSLAQDVRHTLRLIRRAPGFALVVVLTLALGIAANTVSFSAVDGLVLRPYPFPELDRLVGVGTMYPRLGGELSYWENLSAPEYLDIREQSRTLTGVVAWDMGNRQLSGGDAPLNVFSAFWWGDAFPTLGIRPHLGRGFSQAEIERGEAVAIISYRLWVTRFGADSSVVGRAILVNGKPHTVVGVMPPRAAIYGTDLWLPMGWDPRALPRQRRQFQVIARLAPGATLDQANAELETIARRVEHLHGAERPEYAGWKMIAATWTEASARFAKPAAFVLLGAVGFVLLLVCVNVAGLLLARGAGRRREMAVRVALGATRGRVLRQLLTESVLLSALGGVAGLGLAVFGVRALSRLIAGLPIRVAGDVTLNGRVLAVAALVTLVAGVLFGLVPALHAARADIQGMLKSDGPGTTASRSRQRLQRVFLAAEVALSLVLLAGGGLLVNSLVRMSRVDPGFDTSNVLTMRLTLPWERYDGEAVIRFFDRLTQSVAALPGVRSAAAGTQFPPISFSSGELRIEGREFAEGDALPTALLTVAGPGYFETLGLPLLRGRTFTERDVAGAPLVAVINEPAARRYFPGEDPIGKRLGVARGDAWFEIVGVVGAAANRGVDVPPEPEVFASARQLPGTSNQFFLLIRTEVEPRGILPAVREAVRSLDPQQPVYMIQTVKEAFAARAAPRRIAAVALTLFAIFALALATMGVYGVAAYAVSDRTAEIGVRMALGAGRREVHRLIARQALLPVTIGAVVGLAGAVALGRLLSGLLFQVRSGDPLTLAVVTLTLAGAALAASWLPARRAARLDVVRAIRG
ncbi:MAG TPA: ADOP family duplicated permease [Longimicrobiales bacterium]